MESDKLRNAEGCRQLWYAVPEDRDAAQAYTYRAAVLVDCILNFRSLAAGLNSSEERSCTAWLVDAAAAVDWDTPALPLLDTARLRDEPNPAVRPSPLVEPLGEARWADIDRDLIEALVRRERVVLLHNAEFGLYSQIDETREEFLARTAEVALQQVEPELKKLQHVYELQLEQVREARVRPGDGSLEDRAGFGAMARAEVERWMAGRTELSDAENHLASLFTGLAGFVLRLPDGEQVDTSHVSTELHEDITRVEQEATDALNRLFTSYLDKVRACDEYVIRLRAESVRIQQRALLWIPVPTD
jgi:hypothetical protein